MAKQEALVKEETNQHVSKHRPLDGREVPTIQYEEHMLVNPADATKWRYTLHTAELGSPSFKDSNSTKTISFHIEKSKNPQYGRVDGGVWIMCVYFYLPYY